MALVERFSDKMLEVVVYEIQGLDTAQVEVKVPIEYLTDQLKKLIANALV